MTRGCRTFDFPVKVVRWLIAAIVVAAVVAAGVVVTQPAMAMMQRVEGKLSAGESMTSRQAGPPLGHNLLIAGEVPNVNDGIFHSARTLSNDEFERYFSGQEGNVSITGPDGDVNTVTNRYTPGSSVNIANGTGYLDPSNELWSRPMGG